MILDSLRIYNMQLDFQLQSALFMRAIIIKVACIWYFHTSSYSFSKILIDN